MSLSDKVSLFLDRTSFFLFGHGLTPNMRQFLGNISWSFFGGVIASAGLLAVNIFAGRVLGPEEYGRFNVIWAIAQILVVFFCFGMDYSSTHFVSREKNLAGKFISASTYFFLLVVVVSSAIFVFLVEEISSILEFGNEGLIIALSLGVVFSLKQIFDAHIRGLEGFKIQSAVKIAESLVVMLAFAFLYNKLGSQHVSYVYSLIIGSATVAILYFFFLKDFFGSLDAHILNRMFSYGRLMFLASILGILFQSADKLLINKYLSYSDVGVYSAYYTATVALVAQAAVFFNNVFYPLVSKSQGNMSTILKKLDRVSAIFFVPGILLVGTILLIVLGLYGGSYPIDFYLIAGFSILAIIQAIVAANVSIVIAHSEYAIKIGIIYGNAVSLAIVGIYFLLIKNNLFSLYSLVLALIIYYTLTLMMQKYVQYKLKLYQ